MTSTTVGGPMTDEKIERGAAEEGSPLTPTEVAASRRPPSQGDGPAPGGTDTDGGQADPAGQARPGGGSPSE